jgi:pimeloyl-ACP methyl ester carboxylesterase
MTPPSAAKTSERLQVRVYGDAALPTLIYLPGLHGDWTLIGGFRAALGGGVRFAEVTYPRTLDWTLDDYAAAVEEALAARGIESGWLLGESFGSQVVWPMLARQRFCVQGVVLAGGFVRHPYKRLVHGAEWIIGSLPTAALTPLVSGWTKAARFRFRHSPEILDSLEEFAVRRTDLDRRAATHRLRLVALNDPRAIARTSHVPVYALTGCFDPVVPWRGVRRWLRRHCPQLRDYRLIWAADHTVLCTAPRACAEQVLRWMMECP